MKLSHFDGNFNVFYIAITIMYKDKNLCVIFIKNQSYQNDYLIKMHWETPLEF